MKIFQTFVFSCTLVAQLSASVVPSVIERFKAEDYNARQTARVELMQAFADSTASEFDSEARAALETEVLQYVTSDEIPLAGRLYLLRMLEFYGTDASLQTLAQLAESSDATLREAAKRLMDVLAGDFGSEQPQDPNYETALGRLIAYQALLESNSSRTVEVTRQMVDDSEAVGRVRILTAGAHSELESVRALVIPSLLAGSKAEQMIAVGAIREGDLKAYEAAVLKLLPQSSGQLRNDVVACLGVIGTDESFAALYQLYEQNPNDQIVQEAVAGVGAPSADAQALSDAAQSSALQSRIAAVKLLALRNPTGATELLNELLPQAGSLDAALRKAIYKTLEQIGNTETVDLMLDPDLILSDFQKDTQRSLKRVCLSLGIADYLWAESFEPALQANATDDYRAAILAILDGVACEGSVTFLKGLLSQPSSSDYALAYRSLQRWPDDTALYSADMWLLTYRAEHATDTDRSKAEAGIKKVLSNRHPDYYPAQIDFLLEVGESDLPVEFKRSLFSVYAEPADHFYAWYFPHAKRLLQPAVDMPDVSDVAQEIINKL